ncbi:MAG TPA: ParB/RepB/Spo0J family partition protein [Candidatus Tumulicola sp.]
MSTPKRGLGKGLDALLSGSALAPSSRDEALREIPVARISPNARQPRKLFDAQPLDDLQRSIAEYGVLVPVIVRRRGDDYELIAGERRWRASAALQRATIPAIVRDSDDRVALELAMIENLQREDLNPLEEAAGFADLTDEHGLTQDEVAQRLGKSRPAIANALRLLTLPDAIKAMVAAAKLSAGHARALLAAPPERRIALAERAIREGLTVRALERIAAGIATTKVRRRTGLTPDELDFENRLRERYGAHAALVRGKRGGRIELRFTNSDELVRIGELLLGES